MTDASSNRPLISRRSLLGSAANGLGALALTSISANFAARPARLRGPRRASTPIPVITSRAPSASSISG